MTGDGTASRQAAAVPPQQRLPLWRYMLSQQALEATL